jgi:Xaa-Pro dipeptidase
MFKIEDMYWLSGYDSDGFSIFGTMFIGTNGQLTHLSRMADLGNVSYSSICEDVRLAPDSQIVTRAEQVKEMLNSLGCCVRESVFR